MADFFANCDIPASLNCSGFAGGLNFAFFLMWEPDCAILISA